jgi:hypothetical protein
MKRIGHRVRHRADRAIVNISGRGGLDRAL